MIVAAEADEPQALYERLNGRRHDFERAVLHQFRGTFGQADAEDLVSSALERVLITPALPEPEAAEAWFKRVILNVALDELRARHGRAGGDERGGALREVVLFSELAELGQEPADTLADPLLVLEALDEPTRRAEETQRTQAVLAGLDPDDVRLLMIRNVEMPASKGRAACAAAAGLSEEAWRHRYPRAWQRFVAAVAAATPTARCGPVRELIGQLDAGALRNGAAQDARGKVDAHVLECNACHVFARESYRILALTPAVPGIGVGLEHLGDHASSGQAGLEGVLEQSRGIDHVVNQGASFVTRNGEAIAAGGAASGAGLLALLGSGFGGTLKVLAVVCALSVSAAGICGGVVATIHLLDDSPPTRETKAKAKPQSTPSRRIVKARATVAPAKPHRTATRQRHPQKSSAKPKTEPRQRSQPAATASGSTGREFTPIPETAQSQPAPVSAGGGSEFAP